MYFSSACMCRMSLAINLIIRSWCTIFVFIKYRMRSSRAMYNVSTSRCISLDKSHNKPHEVLMYYIVCFKYLMRSWLCMYHASTSWYLSVLYVWRLTSWGLDCILHWSTSWWVHLCISDVRSRDVCSTYPAMLEMWPHKVLALQCTVFLKYELVKEDILVLDVCWSLRGCFSN